ncbi:MULTISPECIES: hypothetical protein [Pseudomonas]|uniref:Alcohol dehydrogenase n=1 Tax=Pseudomonas spirodelae TaxID=3101751 RepID=A0ABU5PD99_9PSED|nr:MULTISPECIES: hypothetical protein [unclassified Pseudomonas]MDD2159083.1 hypothetical protein [Pseudomonas sp. MIL19]MEA1607637.1 hypothetical protein [Pseudomonas sp. T5W1]
MFSFDFYNPTRIVFGRDTISRLDDLVPTEAGVLLLYGGQRAAKVGTLTHARWPLC